MWGDTYTLLKSWIMLQNHFYEIYAVVNSRIFFLLTSMDEMKQVCESALLIHNLIYCILEYHYCQSTPIVYFKKNQMSQLSG